MHVYMGGIYDMQGERNFSALKIGPDGKVEQTAFDYVREHPGFGKISYQVPPEQQVQDILDFFDQSVSNGTLVGYGPGNSPRRRLRALRCMIRAAGVLIRCEYYGWAKMILRAVDRRTDGERRPQDFVVGEAVPTLNQMVNDLIEDLTS